ncbi:MAG: alpha/beta fold hydrolase [Candidatus Thorarchaeota archaeon]
MFPDNKKINQTIELKDGRRLGYSDMGDPNGKPIFHFHGFPGSRLESLLVANKVVHKGIRFIGIDRPGMGLSDFKKNRSLLDWPDDIIELADFLGYNKFSVEGISGGGPYAAVCAYKIPERLNGCAIIGGIGPLDQKTEGLNRMLFFMVRRFFWLFRIYTYFQARNNTNLVKAEKNLKKYIPKLPEPDRIIFNNPENLSLFLEETAEAFRQGSKGTAYEGKIYANPWSFNLEEISPNVKVTIWHGELDINVPVSMGRKMCKLIPNCIGNFLPNEGHYSIAFNHIEEIIDSITL